MATPVVMPQMGESIAEGTVVRWLKKVGDTVERDEPLFEISTDKVDAEIPSPAAGVLTEIKATAGETVPVNSVVATIGQAGETVGNATTSSLDDARPSRASGRPEPVEGRDALSDSRPSTSLGATLSSSPLDQTRSDPELVEGSKGRRAGVASAESAAPAEPVATAEAVALRRRGNGGKRDVTKEAPSRAAATLAELRRQRSSPLVRRIAREHNVDIAEIQGSGIGGRVTKHDILGYLEDRPLAKAGSYLTATAAAASHALRAPDAPRAPQESHRADGVDIQPMSVVRKKIAEHMVLSKRTSAHVHSVFHVNFSTVDRIRQARKAAYERRDAKLTFMSFIAKAAIDAIRRHPIINSSLDGDNVVYKKDVNLGIAVALDNGLIVPVIRNADEKNMLGLSRAIADVASRARAKRLRPEDVQGGTFTITNPGTLGAQFGMPIINQPQVAILGVGIIEKRPVVVDDAIAIRTMAYLTLGYDHRLIDGAVADEFMADVKTQIENFDPSQV